MRMVRRIGLYVGLVLLAALLSAGVAYATARMGVSSTVAPWIGLGAFIVCAGLIVYFMEFQRS
jgi:hypothetical protein